MLFAVSLRPLKGEDGIMCGKSIFGKGALQIEYFSKTSCLQQLLHELKLSSLPLQGAGGCNCKIETPGGVLFRPQTLHRITHRCFY
jgi:hypothetical protein